MTHAEIDALERRLYPHRRAAYAKEFRALRKAANGVPHFPPKWWTGHGLKGPVPHQPVATWVHGVDAYTNRSCRCQVCRAAIRDHHRARRARARAKGAAHAAP